MLETLDAPTGGGEDPEEGKRKDFVGGYGGIKDLSVWTRLEPSTSWLRWANLSFNPVVTIISLGIIIGFAVWAMMMPEEANAEFAAWKLWVGVNFTWLYIGSQDAWAVFIIYLFFSKYGSVRLGPEGSTPEYNDASWFSMLFACGVSTGLFFYGVAEPVFHYIGLMHNKKVSPSSDQLLTRTKPLHSRPKPPRQQTCSGGDQHHPLSLVRLAFTSDDSLYFFQLRGLHGWVVYTIVGLLLALMAHR